MRLWLQAVIRERNGGPNQGLNEDSILPNYVEPAVSSNHKWTFPRSTHMMYPRIEGSAELPGTYWTLARVNMTMYEAMSSVGLISTSGQPSSEGLVSGLSSSESESCPDGAWCQHRDSRGKMSVRRFCALPFICPVRTHHTRYHIPSAPSRGGGRRELTRGLVSLVILLCGLTSNVIVDLL